MGRSTTDAVATAAIAGIVDRPRLHRILDAPFVRVCIVQGPSGSGKTTLLRSWAGQRATDTPLVWVALGTGVRGRQTFWQQVAACAVRLGVMPEGETARVRAQLDAAVDPVRVAIALLADAGPVTLAFDAYENLGDAMEEIDGDLIRMLAALPQLRVVIATRGATSLADQDVPGGVVRIISLAELALTVDEVASLLATQTRLADGSLAQDILAATRGFPLTVRAVVLALSQLGRVPRVESEEWDAVVATKLEGLLPDRVAVQFVIDTSVPPYVDLELAAELSEGRDVAELFDVLERHGFRRWVPFARNHPVFQYVETIRDSFRARAADDAPRFRRSSVVAAEWLFAHDDVDQALLYAIGAGDYGFADRVFAQLLIGNPDTYITDRFLETLRMVPTEALAEHPMLAFGLGLALGANPLLRGDAKRAYRVALESAARPSYHHPIVDDFSLGALRAVALRLTGRIRESAEESLRVVGSVDETPAEVLREYGDHYGTVLRQLSYSLLQGGHIDVAIATMRRSVALCAAPATRDYSLVYAAGASAFAGDLSQARATLASIDPRTWPEEFRESYMNGMGVVAEAYALLDTMDFEGAIESVRSTESYIQTAEFWPLFTAISVVARIGLGQARGEAGRVTRALEASPTPPGVGDNVTTEHLRAMVVFAALAGGDRRTAGRLLRNQREGSPFLAAARVAWLLGAERDEEALARALELLELPGHTLRTRAETQTVGAVAALRQRRPELARAWLDDAAITWEAHGPRMHVALLTPHDRRLLIDFARGRSSAGLRRFLETPVIDEPPRSSTPLLTRRERVVLNGLAEHGSVREIAEALVVSPHTVKAQLQSVYRKLGVSSRRAALSAGREAGLIGPDGSRSSEAD
jgi:LuxR family maltose regulon positive regulatory protein